MDHYLLQENEGEELSIAWDGLESYKHFFQACKIHLKTPERKCLMKETSCFSVTTEPVVWKCAKGFFDTIHPFEPLNQPFNTTIHP